ncbi:MAG TPA: sterol desaturase family protein [Sandaracinaceae bacterium]
MDELANDLWRVASDPDLLAQGGALAGGLVLVAIAARLRELPPTYRASVAQDGAYVASRALVTLPLTLAILDGLRRLVAAFAPGIQLGWLPGLPGWAQVLVYFVLMDAVAYGVHRAFHAVPWLWPFHAIHHSQRNLNALTTTRIHVVELVVKRVVSFAPLAVLGEPTETLALLVCIDGFWGFFVHSGLRVPLGPLRYVLVEPDYHRLHHAQERELADTNYAERLVIWDLLLGSARFETPRALATGIDDATFPHERDASLTGAVSTWVAQLLYPFRKLASGSAAAGRPRADEARAK